MLPPAINALYAFNADRRDRPFIFTTLFKLAVAAIRVRELEAGQITCIVYFVALVSGTFLVN